MLVKEVFVTVQQIIAECKMQTGTAYMEHHIMDRNICAEYAFEVPKSKWKMPPKVVRNNRANILLDFLITIPSDSNTKKKKHNAEQGLKEMRLKRREGKGTLVPMVI